MVDFLESTDHQDRCDFVINVKRMDWRAWVRLLYSMTLLVMFVGSMICMHLQIGNRRQMAIATGVSFLFGLRLLVKSILDRVRLR